jgi:hypothetical protein
MNNTEHKPEIKENKTKDRKTYMREYMRKYNETRKKRRVYLSAEQRRTNLKEQQKEYYNKNKTTILNKRKIKHRQNRIKELQDQITSLS